MPFAQLACRGWPRERERDFGGGHLRRAAFVPRTAFECANFSPKFRTLPTPDSAAFSGPFGKTHGGAGALAHANPVGFAFGRAHPTTDAGALAPAISATLGGSFSSSHPAPDAQPVKYPLDGAFARADRSADFSAEFQAEQPTDAASQFCPVVAPNASSEPAANATADARAYAFALGPANALALG